MKDERIFKQAEKDARDLTENLLKLKDEMEISQFQIEEKLPETVKPKIIKKNKPNYSAKQFSRIKRTRVKKGSKDRTHIRKRTLDGKLKEPKSKTNNNLDKFEKKDFIKSEVRKRVKKHKKQKKRRIKRDKRESKESVLSKTLELKKESLGLVDEYAKQDVTGTQERNNVAKSRMSLQWRKQRIAGYGRVKGRGSLPEEIEALREEEKGGDLEERKATEQTQKSKQRPKVKSRPKPKPKQKPKSVKSSKKPKVIKVKNKEVLREKEVTEEVADRGYNSPSDLRKRDILKINSRFWKETQQLSKSPEPHSKPIVQSTNDQLRSPDLTANGPKRRHFQPSSRNNNTTPNLDNDRHESGPNITSPPHIRRNGSREWRRELTHGESGSSNGHNESSLRQVEFSRNSNQAPLTTGTGGQAVSQHRTKAIRQPDEDKHFLNLMARNANITSNKSLHKNEIKPTDVPRSPHGNVRSRLRTLKKTDSKKERDLNRLKKFKERLRHQDNSPLLASVNLRPRGTFQASRESNKLRSRRNTEDARPPFSRTDLSPGMMPLNRISHMVNPEHRGHSPADLIIENKISSEVDLPTRANPSSRYRNLPRKMQQETKDWGPVSASPDLLRVEQGHERSNSGMSSDLMVKNKVLMVSTKGQPKIGTIPEFDEGQLRPVSGEIAKKQYRRDRVRELGKRLKQKSGNKHRGVSDIDKFLDNI